MHHASPSNDFVCISLDGPGAEEIITKRVKYHDDTMDQCMGDFLLFYDALNSDAKSASDVERASLELLDKLEWLRLASALGRQSEVTLRSDIAIFEQQLSALRTERGRILEHMKALQLELEEATRKRDHASEYALIVRHIEAQPPRRDTRAKLEQMQGALHEMKQALAQCTQTIERRSKQCYAAFAAVQALSRAMAHTTQDGDVVIK